jgi:hypothetical protein
LRDSRTTLVDVIAMFSILEGFETNNTKTAAINLVTAVA